VLGLSLRPAPAHAEPGFEVFVLFFGTPVALLLALLTGGASFFFARRWHRSTLFKVLSTMMALGCAFAAGELLWAACMFAAEAMRPGSAKELVPPGGGYSVCTLLALGGWLALTVVRLRRKSPASDEAVGR
jgi:hypothetical protein